MVGADDKFAGQRNYLGPSDQMVAVTPSDSADLTFVTRGVYVGVAGDLTVTPAYGASASVLFKAVPAGSLLPIRVSRIWATGTTATQIVALC